MKCPKCGEKAKASATKFIEYSHSQRRIRTCDCGYKFITHEVIEPDKQDFGKHSKQKKKEYYRSWPDFEDIKNFRKNGGKLI